MRFLTTSPMETMPISSPSSTTGTWRKRCAVIMPSIAPRGSLGEQVTTGDVIKSDTRLSKTALPCLCIARTRSRSERMPAIPPLVSSARTAPIRCCAISASASATGCCDSRETTLPPLPFKISETNILSSPHARLQVAHRFLDEHVHHRAQRPLRRRSGGEPRGVGRELPMRARSARDDRSALQDFRDAITSRRVLAGEFDQLLEQIGARHHLALTEIDQPFVDAVALRPPAVLRDQHVVVEAPALVPATQAIQHADHALPEGGHRDRVVERGADVGDPHLERLETRGRSKVPPDHRRVLDQAGIDEDIDVPPVLAPRVEARGQAGARQL